MTNIFYIKRGCSQRILGCYVFSFGGGFLLLFTRHYIRHRAIALTGRTPAATLIIQLHGQIIRKLIFAHIAVSKLWHSITIVPPGSCLILRGLSRALEERDAVKPELLRYDTAAYRNQLLPYGTCYMNATRLSSPRLLRRRKSGFKARSVQLSGRILNCPTSIRPCTVRILYATPIV